MAIILASASPRRRQLLEQVGCKFSIVTSEVKENNQLAIPPEQLVIRHALAKARAVSAEAAVGAEDVVIGADTIVVLNGTVFGKPADALGARQMLTALSGNSHLVITGIAVIRSDAFWTDYAQTKVEMMQLTADEIERYIATGEPLDKAGAYAIQGRGAMFVRCIQGCYSNVVGLPLNSLAGLFKKAGINLL